MEKETIIAFLNDHWDEFVSILADTNRHDGKEIRMEQFPDHIREFTAALSTLVASYQTQCENTQTEQEVHQDAMSADWVPDAAFECCDADNRGLLEKAQNFRRYGLPHDAHTARSIIIQNGLFVVQPQQNRNKLNTAFKNLVDSVL